MIIVFISLLLLIEASLIFKCFQWHWRFRTATKRLQDLRQQIGTPYGTPRWAPLEMLQTLWDNSCLIGFVIYPPFIYLLYVVLGYSGTTYVYLLAWLAMPFGELCGIVNRCGILNMRILNSELELMRRSCLLYTSPSPRDRTRSRMPSSA